MAVMGGIAVSFWKSVRATRDVELLIAVPETGLDPVLEALADAGFRAKWEPPVPKLGPLRIVQLLFEPPGASLEVQVDLLLADSDYHRTALRRRVPVRLP